MTANRRPLSEREQTTMRNILRQAPIGYLGLVADGPYVVPINFVHDGSDEPDNWGNILFHSGEGRKSGALAAEPRVCLAVLGETSFDRGAAPCDDGFAYRSALVEGTATLIGQDDQRERALRMIVAKYDPEKAHEPFDIDVLERTLVYSVTIEAVSFKERRRRS